MFKRKDGRQVNWLEDHDMLPAAVPEASIFTYDWNANYFEDAPVDTLLGHADALLTLVSETQSSGKRPIIFVASCFGGLVLAKAVTRAAQEGSLYRHILAATVGIVFLATPFRGSDAAREATWQVVVGGVMGNHTSDQLVRDLKQKYARIHELVQKFAEIASADAAHLPLYCFYETKPTKILRQTLPPKLAAMISPRKIVRISS